MGFLTAFFILQFYILVSSQDPDYEVRSLFKISCGTCLAISGSPMSIAAEFSCNRKSFYLRILKRLDLHLSQNIVIDLTVAEVIKIYLKPLLKA